MWLNRRSGYDRGHTFFAIRLKGGENRNGNVKGVIRDKILVLRQKIELLLVNSSILDVNVDPSKGFRDICGFLDGRGAFRWRKSYRSG